MFNYVIAFPVNEDGKADYNLTFAYNGSYDNIFTDVSFCLDTDWKLGFCGRNGRGKTTFLKLLMGQYEYSGTISASLDVEYFPYHIADPTQKTFDILAAIAPDAPLWKIQRELSLLSVAEDALTRPFATLSNGEQTKALLAGLFLRENSFLLIDEPTNHLDVMGRETVSRYLYGKSGYILVSHDRVFLDECVDHCDAVFGWGFFFPVKDVDTILNTQRRSACSPVNMTSVPAWCLNIMDKASHFSSVSSINTASPNPMTLAK